MSYYTALEDLFEDVVGKALRRQGLAQRDVEQRSGLKAGDLARITGGGFVPDDARIAALANLLGLHGQRLADSARCAWFPKNPDGAIGNPRIGVDMLVVDGSMVMNSYIFWDQETKEAAFIDPGDEANRLLESVQRRGLKPVQILLTHGHGDHTGALRQVKQRYDIPTTINERDLPLLGGLRALIDETIEEGWESKVGGLNVRAMALPGHTAGGIGFSTEDVLFSGDALFAGSMGGTRNPDAYASQIRAVRDKALKLPEATTVFPGHGPASTVGEERRHNPFIL